MSKIYKMKIGNGYYYGKKCDIIRKICDKYDVTSVRGKAINEDIIKKKLSPYQKTNIRINGELTTIEEVTCYEF